jgi:hypothetical protein
MNQENASVRVAFLSESSEIVIQLDDRDQTRPASPFDGIRFKIDFLASKGQSAAAWLVGTAALSALQMRRTNGIGLDAFSISHEEANNSIVASLDARALAGDAAAQFLKASLLLTECLRTSDESLLDQSEALLKSAAKSGDDQASRLLAEWPVVKAEHLRRIRKKD